MRDTKYRIVGESIVNRETGKALRLGEPIFIIRAQDVYAVPTLRMYSIMSSDPLTVHKAISEFRAWQADHPDLLKVPD